ncbi:MAG: FkbM family methyltransferase [Chthoniobacteraceae bacterium]
MINILSVIPPCPRIKVLDIGAMATGDDIYTALTAAGLATIIGFECVQEECEKLNAASNGVHRFLPYALGDGRQRTLYHGRASMTSSLYEADMALLEKFQNLANLAEVVRRETIATHRLDDIPEAADPDFIKLDVQGAELDVMNGADNALATSVVIHTEVAFLHGYKDAPLFAEVDQRLRRAGFVFHRFHGFGSRAFKPLVINNDLNQGLSQMLWADAVYVRDFMALDQVPADKLLKMAVILHLIYGSVDLALQVLMAYDAKMASTTASAYLSGLTGQML